MRHILFASALAGAAALAGCASNQSFIGASTYDSGYTPGEHLLYGPAIQTFVRGSPFTGMTGDAATAAVLADMQNGGFPETTFTTATIPRSPYRVLMIFSPTPGTDLDRLCETAPASIGSLPEAVTPPDSGRIGLDAVFCRADKLMAGAGGTIPRSARADDPAVAGAIKGFMRQIFPSRNPENDVGSDTPP